MIRNDAEIYDKVKKYFIIQELVSKRVYNKYGDRAWKFLCPRMLETLIVVREAVNSPITINNWHVGGKFSQRGLRSNLGYIFLSKFKKGRMYLSAHIMGKAVDFDVKGMTAPEVRQFLKGIHKDLPYKIRLENKLNGKQISWVHLDVFFEEKNNKVYLFDI